MNIKTIRKIMLVFCIIAAAGIIFSCNNNKNNTEIIIENSEKASEIDMSPAVVLSTEDASPVADNEIPIYSEDCVNINTADLEELKSLPGIGDVKANAIITYRENTSVFFKIEDIMNVPGIKEGAFNRIKDRIKV